MRAEQPFLHQRNERGEKAEITEVTAGQAVTAVAMTGSVEADTEAAIGGRTMSVGVVDTGAGSGMTVTMMTGVMDTRAAMVAGAAEVAGEVIEAMVVVVEDTVIPIGTPTRSMMIGTTMTMAGGVATTTDGAATTRCLLHTVFLAWISYFTLHSCSFFLFSRLMYVVSNARVMYVALLKHAPWFSACFIEIQQF